VSGAKRRRRIERAQARRVGSRQAIAVILAMTRVLTGMPDRAYAFHHWMYI
jgi:hypothetical protein